MILETIPVGPLQCNCSILGDETSREAIVVDPGDDIPRILALLAKHALTVKQIVITHAHIDHIAGAHRLKRVTGAPILYNQNDLPLVAMMDLQAGWLGIPTPEVPPPDDTLDAASTEGVQGILQWLREAAGGGNPTVRDVMHLMSRRTRVVGTPEQIADRLAEYRAAGGDGCGVLEDRGRDGRPISSVDAVAGPGQRQQRRAGCERDRCQVSRPCATGLTSDSALLSEPRIEDPSQCLGDGACSDG